MGGEHYLNELNSKCNIIIYNINNEIDLNSYSSTLPVQNAFKVTMGQCA